MATLCTVYADLSVNFGEGWFSFKFTKDDFIPIEQSRRLFIVPVHKESPKTLEDFIDYARKNPQFSTEVRDWRDTPHCGEILHRCGFVESCSFGGGTSRPFWASMLIPILISYWTMLENLQGGGLRLLHAARELKSVPGVPTVLERAQRCIFLGTPWLHLGTPAQVVDILGRFSRSG
jgi:hypothetical protein